jgi:DNA polymerase-1
MGLPGGTKTKTGQWSTTAQALEDLAAEGHELPRKIVDWRQLTKLKSTYTDALPGFINPETKRVHTSFRWRRPPPGGFPRRIRTCRTFRCARPRAARSAPPSSPNRAHVLISADYSQIELRVLAHVADIAQLNRPLPTASTSTP